MYFPSIEELATVDVKSVSIKASLSDAIEIMLQAEHRKIIIIQDKKFFALDVYDILRINRAKINIATTLEQLQLVKLPTIAIGTNILEALELLNYNHEHIAVINSDGSFFGLVAQSDIISSIDPDTLMDNYRLSDLLKSTKRDRWISKDICTADVLDDMERYNHDSTIIVEDLKPVGIITSKDILRLLKNNNDLTLPVHTYMSHPINVIHYNATINEALKFIKDKHYKRIVTVDDEGRLAGVILQKELVSITYSRWVQMMKQHQEELQQINQILEKKSKKLEKIASFDSLTGLYNRMKFMELFTSEYTVMTQRHNTMSLMMIDLDHFKTINDTYGHNIGDNILKQISNLLLRELRNVDVLCRWGGEEFIALLPTATAEQSVKIAEHIRQAIESYKEFDIPNITASFGVTQVLEGDTLEGTVNRADVALYEAKNSGRNCVKSN